MDSNTLAGSVYTVNAREETKAVLQEGAVWVKAAKDIGDNYYLPIFYVTDKPGPEEGWTEWLKEGIRSESGLECAPAVHIEAIMDGEVEIYVGWIRVHTKRVYNSLMNVLRVTSFSLGYPIHMNHAHGYGAKIMVRHPLKEDIAEDGTVSSESKEEQCKVN